MLLFTSVTFYSSYEKVEFKLQKPLAIHHHILLVYTPTSSPLINYRILAICAFYQTCLLQITVQICGRCHYLLTAELSVCVLPEAAGGGGRVGAVGAVQRGAGLYPARRLRRRLASCRPAAAAPRPAARSVAARTRLGRDV